MNEPQNESRSDLWSDWLLHHRQADDPEYGRSVRSLIEGYTERLLDGARLAPGMSIADVGAGEGLVSFRAIERVGPSLRVLLTDISPPLLRHAERLALERGVWEQCAFLNCPAEKLTGIADASLDAVLTRAVLAYVPDKAAALREFYRVLKPGGRISLVEPIFRDDAILASTLKIIVENQPLESQDRFAPLLYRWKAAQFPDTQEKTSQSPLTNYSERDLLRMAQETGFSEIHLELHIDVLPSLITSWRVLLDYAPHPLAPPLRRILAEEFNAEERQHFEEVLRPVVEAGKSPTLDRNAYLCAKKPNQSAS